MSLISKLSVVMTCACVIGLGAGCGALGQMAQGGADKPAEKKAELAADDTKTAEPAAEPAADVPEPMPNAELRTSLLKCNDTVKPMDVQSGRVGQYKFTEGMATSERTGFLDRKPVTMTNGCFLGEMKAGDCFSWTVDEKKYAALGNSNEWEVQCVYSDKPGDGVIKNKSEYPYTMDRLNPHYFMLMCNHDQGDGYECLEGSNSMRGGKWREKLKAQGKVQMGFCANKYAYQETTYEDKEYPKGRWVYCQYYNKKSNQSMAAFEFLQTTNN